MYALPRRHLTLTERRPATCVLDAEDASYLAERHRAHLEIGPAAPGSYHVRPRGCIGVIAAPHTLLDIRPKIPLANFLWLLDGSDIDPAGDGGAGGTAGATLLDLCARRLAALMAQCAARGLQRSYREVRQLESYLQGRLDVAEQLRRGPTTKDRLACRHDEYTLDVPHNQVPRATAATLLAGDMLSEGARAALAAVLGAFGDVSAVPLTPQLFAAAAVAAAPPGYAPLLDLCHAICEGCLALQYGGGVLPTFLLNLEQVFERHVSRHVEAALAAQGDLAVRAQVTRVSHLPVAGQPPLAMRPDLVIERDGAPVLVADVKWKAPFATSDVYQVLAYCAALGCGCGLLIYPGSRNRAWHYSFPASNVHLAIVQVHVTGPIRRCRKALGEFLQFLARLCDDATDVDRAGLP